MVNTGENVNIMDVYQDSRFNPSVDEMTGFCRGFSLCVPVMNREGKIIGLTEAIKKNEKIFYKHDDDLLRPLSSQLSISLENAQPLKKIINMKTDLESIHASISNSIISLDNNYRLTTANQSAITLLNCQETRIIGNDIRDVIGRRNKQIIKDIKSVYTTKQPRFDYDLDLQTRWRKQY